RRERRERRAEAARVALKHGAHARDGFEALTEREDFRRRSQAGARAARQAFDVVDVLQRGEKLGALFLAGGEPGDVLLAARDRGGGGDGERRAREAEGRERARAEVLLEDAAGARGVEGGVRSPRDEAGQGSDVGGEALRDEQLRGRDALKLGERGRRVQLGRGE